MEDKNFQTSFNVTTNTAAVFDSINEIDKWWTEDLDGSSVGLNNIFTVHFGDTWKTFKVNEFIRSEKISWEVTNCWLPWNPDKTEWIGTYLIFEISEKDNQSEVRFSHKGLKESAECFEACSRAWTSYLQNSLYDFITTGIGKANKKR